MKSDALVHPFHTELSYIEWVRHKRHTRKVVEVENSNQKALVCLDCSRILCTFDPKYERHEGVRQEGVLVAMDGIEFDSIPDVLSHIDNKCESFARFLES